MEAIKSLQSGLLQSQYSHCVEEKDVSCGKLFDKPAKTWYFLFTPYNRSAQRIAAEKSVIFFTIFMATIRTKKNGGTGD